MYSFAQRADTTVVDEPLYGHYLTVSGAQHPGGDEVIAHMDCDGARVAHELATAPVDTDLLFMKHMAHHLVALDESVLDAFDNVLLIRDPHDMLPSLTIQIPDATLADTGLKRQAELFSSLAARGRTPAVIESRELLRDPGGVLARLCEQLRIPFDANMLSWPAGPRPEDGIWAPHWYHAVHKSTGFGQYTAKTDFPTHLEPLLAECQPHYDTLLPHIIRAPHAETEAP